MLIAAALALLVAILTGELLAICGFPLPAGRGRIGCLDGLRGYLALIVMVHHFDIWMNRVSAGGGWGKSSNTLLHNLGPIGVALFFMTTGAVFYGRVKQGFSAVDWRSLYLQRIFRILPLQITTILFVAVISALMAHHEATASVSVEIKSILMWLTTYGEPPILGYPDSSIVNAKVLWSLWFEWIFYISILPALALIGERATAFVPSWIVPAALLLIGLGLRLYFKYPAVIFYLPLFAIGMLAIESASRTGLVRVFVGWPFSLLLVSLVAYVATHLDEPYYFPQLVVLGVFFTAVVSGNSVGGILSLRGSIILGEVSFGIYLVHGIVLYVIFTFLSLHSASDVSIQIALPAASAVAVLLSAAAHLLIERPGMAAGKRLAGLWRKARRPQLQGSG